MRESRTVLREAGGEVPPAYSPNATPLRRKRPQSAKYVRPIRFSKDGNGYGKKPKNPKSPSAHLGALVKCNALSNAPLVAWPTALI